MSLLPPSTLLIGPAGTGKTTSLATLLKLGIKVRMLATEPSAPNRVIARCKTLSIPDAGFDWHFVSPATASWDAMRESARIVNAMSLKDIADMRTGIARPQSKQWVDLIEAVANFPSSRNPGAKLGDVTEWGDDTAFVIDGLSGVNIMSRNLTVGLKPNPSPGEWGVMQANIFNLLQKLASDCKCFFVCIAHVERETNELTGLSAVTVSTLGAKLAPKLPPLFTNVVYAKRLQDRFFWSTAETNVDTKNGDLPMGDMLEPSFSLIVEPYRERRKGLDEPVQNVA